ncbi:MAG TPA: methyltransferase domain-containing protein [Actinomycetota bacterium]|nr:methyltransferase domain-containing protein [Actinomycetota bacterium]
MTRSRAQNLIERYFSWAADRFYDSVTVQRVFPLLGGDLNEGILEQGRRAVAVAGGQPILDMPVGTAYFTVRIAREHSGIVVGSDIAEGMVVRARDVARSEGVDNLPIVQADAHRLPFRDGAFGAVLCANGLPVIPGLHATVTELARVLASGGVLFVAAITLPLGPPGSPRSRERMPTAFRPKGDIAEALRRAGLEAKVTQRRRLAALIEANKPARTSRRQVTP